MSTCFSLIASVSFAAALTVPTATWKHAQAVARMRGWIEEAVIRIGLCPYASKPFYDETIRQRTACAAQHSALALLRSAAIER